MIHVIPDNVPNSAVILCINEYVRRERDRNILQDHWFGGLSLMALAEKYDLSLTAVKKVVYEVGDVIISKVTQN